MRRTLVILRGRFSSQLDMGGVPAAAADTKLDLGKNNKLRAIALDFDLLTRSMEKDRGEDLTVHNLHLIKEDEMIQPVKPNVGLVESIANLLNVQLGSEGGPPLHKNEEDDDLSTLTALSYDSKEQKKQDNDVVKSMNAPLFMDIRSKYADKLRRKLDGGLSGVDRMKAEQEESLKRGDAKGHFSARKVAMSSPSITAWMAATGVGKLLSYLSSRSMKIVLIPKLDGQSYENGMNQMEKQLQNIVFHEMVHKATSPDEVLDIITDKTNVLPLGTLLVSDDDSYLRAARFNEMFTCRVRPKNTRRGNVTTDYTVGSMAEVEDVINEVNGISFNSVFSMR